MLASQFGNQKGRDLRRIGKGLVVQRGQIGDHRPRLLRLHIQFGVVGAQVRSHRPRILRFVEAIFAKADGEGAHRLARLGLHQRDDRR